MKDVLLSEADIDPNSHVILITGAFVLKVSGQAVYTTALLYRISDRVILRLEPTEKDNTDPKKKMQYTLIRYFCIMKLE
jgi:hypothetical protein